MQKLSNLPAFKDAQNIILESFDPVSAGGFTQIPNLLLNNTEMSFAAKVVYSKLLSYAWNNNMVFPGQERMAEEIGSSKSAVNRAVLELQERGWLQIDRRGQGKTNVYILKHTITPRRRS